MFYVTNISVFDMFFCVFIVKAIHLTRSRSILMIKLQVKKYKRKLKKIKEINLQI